MGPVHVDGVPGPHLCPRPVTGSGVVEWRTTAARTGYVRAELRHETAAGPLPGAMAAFTNPEFPGR
ncbi:hypothetical protein FBY22_7711 [Streptomyces sp. SLBN-31]|nr:hypothetical protein FBY22_7711 [Streptomyces sp. SLBN-31]